VNVLIGYFALISMILTGVLGIGAVLVLIGIVYDKFFSWLLTYIGIKRDFIRFMWDRIREKRRARQ